MTGVLLGGAVAGLGFLILGLVLAPPRAQPSGALARLDMLRAQQRAEVAAVHLGYRNVGGSVWVRGLGRRTASMLASFGLGLAGLRADLAILGRTIDRLLATSVLAALGGLLAPSVGAVVLTLAGISVTPAVPLAVAILAALVGASLPALRARSQAAERRRDFRHVVGSFLDLVAMSLAGGRGVPEALRSASEISDGWATVRIRNTLVGARLRGETPWSALAALGDELRIDELRDLGAALALVAEDGAKVRESLAARADSMRRRELAESEGRAGEASQSMLVAQLLIALGFLVFLVYPALMSVFDAM